MSNYFIYNQQRLYVGTVTSPAGVVPRNSTKIKPLPQKEGTMQVLAADGWSYVNMTAVEATPIIEAKASAIDSIVTAIDVVHATLLAGPAAQETIYTMKAAEAAAYIAAGYPTSGVNYPMLAAEATATSVTKHVAADLIIATRAAWYALLGTIEGIRRTATAAINLATIAPEIKTIKAKAISDLKAL